MLGDASGSPEILWYFSQFSNEKRLYLAQNPQFYAVLPPQPAEYMGIFNRQPIEIYQNRVDVLTNNDRRVFLESNPQPGIFDNVWVINGILIFKSSCVVFLFLPRLTSFQTLSEISRAKPSSNNLFQTSLWSSLAGRIQYPHRLGIWTGERRFSAYGMLHILVYTYVLRNDAGCDTGRCLGLSARN